MGVHDRGEGTDRAWRHPLKADPTRQWRLLDLQALDTRLDQLAHARSHLPQLAEIAQEKSRLATLDAEVVRSETALGDVQREVARAESDVQQVRDRATRNQSRLDAGTGTAKDLQALQHELQSLARRQGELEDVEIEIMERAEGLESETTELQTRQRELGEALTRLEEVRDASFVGLDREAETVAAPRASIVDGVGDDLVTLYEKIRASSGGVGAAALHQRRCGGCQLELNQVEIGTIAKADPDEVFRCEECRRILIRTAESGV